jgi:hypothetical protein
VCAAAACSGLSSRGFEFDAGDFIVQTNCFAARCVKGLRISGRGIPFWPAQPDLSNAVDGLFRLREGNEAVYAVRRQSEVSTAALDQAKARHPKRCRAALALPKKSIGI